MNATNCRCAYFPSIQASALRINTELNVLYAFLYIFCVSCCWARLIITLSTCIQKKSYIQSYEAARRMHSTYFIDHQAMSVIAVIIIPLIGVYLCVELKIIMFCECGL